VASLVALLLWAGCQRLPDGDPERPDILLVSVDSLRADHLGAWGYERETSPNLDRLAASGQRYAHARSASPWTLPAHVTMLTGKWPTEHQVVEDVLALPPTTPMIQERLQAAGWATAGLTATTYVSGSFGFSRGFDRWNDGGVTERNNLQHSVRINTQVDEALTWADALPEGQPAFLFLHTYDVHYPYLPPPPWDARFDAPATPDQMRYRRYTWYLDNPLRPARLAAITAQYDESIAWVDSELGRLFREWDRPRRIIVTSDHGEELGERGSWGHGHVLTPEVLEIPLILAGEGIPRAVREERVGSIDVANTIAALAGLEGLGGDGLDLRDPIPARRFWEETSRFDSRRLGLLDGDTRLDLDLRSGGARLFDLTADPTERTDVGGQRLPEVSSMRRLLLSHLGTPWSLQSGELSTDGYVFQDGALVARPDPARPFGVWPPQAMVGVDGKGSARAGVSPGVPGSLWRNGRPPATTVDLGKEVREQLEALGYVQE